MLQCPCKGLGPRWCWHIPGRTVQEQCRQGTYNPGDYLWDSRVSHECWALKFFFLHRCILIKCSIFDIFKIVNRLTKSVLSNESNSILNVLKFITCFLSSIRFDTDMKKLGSLLTTLMTNKLYGGPSRYGESKSMLRIQIYMELGGDPNTFPHCNSPRISIISRSCSWLIRIKIPTNSA